MSHLLILLLTFICSTLQRLPLDWEVNICDINIRNIQGQNKEISNVSLVIILLLVCRL